MSGPADRIIRTTTCALCDRGRMSVPALVELSPGRCLCSECARTAVEALVDHYGDVSPFVAMGEQPAVPV